MFLFQIAQAPVVIRIANEKGEPAWEVVIPKYKLKDAIAWGAAVREQWRSEIVEGMEEKRAKDVLALNPPVPPTIADLKRLLATPDGAREVLETQVPQITEVFKVEKSIKKVGKKRIAVFQRGKRLDTAQELDNIKKGLLAMGPGPSCHLAWEVADVDDAKIAQMTTDLPPEDETEGEKESPLTGSGGEGSIP